MQRKNLFTLLFIIVAFIACNRKSNMIHYEKSFAESLQISQKYELPLCYVLYDSLQITPQEYIDKLYMNKIPLNKGVFNFLNIVTNKNKWYNKLLSPQILPVSCIFNTSGELIDLIPGSSQESLLYIDDVLTTQKMNTEFHYNKLYNSDKLNAIKIIDKTLKIKIKIDRHENVMHEIDSLLKRFRDPYLLFLKLQNQLQFNDTTSAIETAKDLLSFDSAKNLSDYYDEFMFANQIIDPNYNIETAPSIKIVPPIINIKNCKINETLPLFVNITNDGQKPLKISEILIGCNCMRLISSSKHIIYPNQSIEVEIRFTPDEPGDIFREIFIASNSIHTPISRVTIKAIVN